MANFKVGDEVMCVDAIPVQDSFLNFHRPIRSGEKYVVAALKECCGRSAIRLAGIEVIDTSCPYCKKVSGGTYFRAWRFIKLDGLQETQDERTEQEA